MFARINSQFKIQILLSIHSCFEKCFTFWLFFGVRVITVCTQYTPEDARVLRLSLIDCCRRRVPAAIGLGCYVYTRPPTHFMRPSTNDSEAWRWIRSKLEKNPP